MFCVCSVNLMSEYITHNKIRLFAPSLAWSNKQIRYLFVVLCLLSCMSGASGSKLPVRHLPLFSDALSKNFASGNNYRIEREMGSSL